MTDFFIGADPQHIKVERSKAQKIRSSQWWKRKLNEGICYYCDNKFAASELTMDHKVPLVRGGYSTKANLVTACKDCNNQKKYELATEFMPESQADT